MTTPSAELVLTLTTRLKEALAQAEATDFRALDRALFEGVTSAQLETFSREELHRQLVFALAETVLSDGDAQASDWVVEAVRLFLTRLGGSKNEVAGTEGGSINRQHARHVPGRGPTA